MPENNIPSESVFPKFITELEQVMDGFTVQKLARILVYCGREVSDTKYFHQLLIDNQKSQDVARLLLYLSTTRKNT